MRWNRSHFTFPAHHYQFTLSSQFPNTALKTARNFDADMRGLIFICFSLLFFSSRAQIFDITNYGATGDGVTINTLAIQAAIDSCHNAGGGTVQVPPGNFVTGTVVLKSNVTIHLLQGATILGSSSMSDYPDMIPQMRTYADRYPQKSVFYAEGQHNIGITGQGTFNGQGLSLSFISVHSNSPMGFRFISCSNVTYTGVTLQNSAFWMMHNFNIDTLTIKNLHIVNQAYGNNDGVDIDGCRNVLVDSCTADCNDDAIVIKTCSTIGNNNIEIKNCTVATYSRALKIGTETFGPTSNVYIHDCNVVFSTAGIYGSTQAALGGINLSSVDGGSLQNILIENINMTGVGAPIFIRLGNAGITYDTLPVPPTGFIDNVRLNNIVATASTDTTSSITGIPGFPMQNIQLSNIDITFPGGWPALRSNFTVPENISSQPQATIFGDTLPGAGLYIRHVDSMLMHNVCFHAIRPDGRPNIYLDSGVTNPDTSGIGNCGTAGIHTLDLNNDLTIYPNPSTGGSVLIQCSDALTGGTVKLMSMEGTSLRSIPSSTQTQEIKVSDLPAGVYFVLFTKNDISITRKLVKL
jgi:hypothetical protein